MELNIAKETQNPLFNRKELEGMIKAQAIPSKVEVAKALAEKYSVSMEAIRVLEVQGNFGSSEFKLKANVYPSKEERDKLENISKKESEAEKKALDSEKESQDLSASESGSEQEAVAPKEEAPAETEEAAPAEETKPEPAPETEAPKEEAPAEEGKLSDKKP